MMIFGGSPHIVAEPPRFEQKISEMSSESDKMQKMRQLYRDRCQKKNNGNTVDKHRQKRRHQHK